MTEAPMPAEPADPNAEQSVSSPTNWGVALCALASLVLMLLTGLYAVVHDVSRETRDPLDLLKAFAPHLLVVVAAVSGFRVTANILAILSALGWGFLSGFLVLISLGTSGIAVLFTLIQLALIILAIADLNTQRNRPWPRITMTRRLSGVALGALIAIGIGATLNLYRRAGERARTEHQAQQTRDSLAEIAEHARVLASPAWQNTSALWQLHRLTYCIDVFHRSSSLSGGPFPRSFADLVRWATSSEQRGYRSHCYTLLRDADTSRTPPLLDPHHIVRYRPPRDSMETRHARGYLLELEAVWDSTDEPVAPGSPGAKNYLLDAAGKVHMTAARRRATSSDRIVPLCPPTDPNLRDVCWIDAE